MELAAQVVGQCEAKVVADVQVSCEGTCGGTCNGSCDGQCAGGTGGGQCNGQCSGTCNGSCSASCNGSANVEASMECKASAEIHANVNTVCSEPKVEVVYETTTVVDDSKLQKAKMAIMHGLPTLLQVGAKAKIVLGAVGYWAQTAGSLVKSGGQLI